MIGKALLEVASSYEVILYLGSARRKTVWLYLQLKQSI
jgi:hypothetical protein